MITSIRSLIKKHPVIFGVLVFVGSVVSGMFTILLAGSLYVEITCKYERGSSSWAGMNDLFFFITTSPLLLIWSGFNTYCASKCKPANTMIWMAVSLFLYGSWFYSRLGSYYCN